LKNKRFLRCVFFQAGAVTASEIERAGVPRLDTGRKAAGGGGTRRPVPQSRYPRGGGRAIRGAAAPPTGLAWLGRAPLLPLSAGKTSAARGAFFRVGVFFTL